MMNQLNKTRLGFNGSSLTQQNGVALVVSLVILVALTMLGLSSIQRTTSDLAMAGNQRELGLMFQASEIGLISAERYIEAQTSNDSYENNSNGLFAVIADDANWEAQDYFDNGSWTDLTSQKSLVNIEPQPKDTPRFMVEYLGDRSNNPNKGLQVGEGYTPSPGKEVSIYRTTARGTGLTGNSHRYVQSYFGKKI